MDIVIVRFLALGDVLLTLPLAEALRRNPAVRRVDLVTDPRFAAVPEAGGHYDTVLRVEAAAGAGLPTGLRERTYDLLVDLHARSVALPTPYERAVRAIRARRRVSFGAQWAAQRPGQLSTRRWDEHAVEYYARAVPDLVTGVLPEGRIRLPARARRWAAGQHVDGVVCLAPGARYRFKRWPAGRYAALARLLRAGGIEAVAVGHYFDAEVVAAVAAAAGCRTVVESDELRLAAVLGRAGTAVTNNSGLMHLAQLSGARCACVHSHTSPTMWRPWGAGHANLVGTGSSCACDDIGAFEADFPCGKDIEPDAVAEAVAGLLRPPPAPGVVRDAGSGT